MITINLVVLVLGYSIALYVGYKMYKHIKL